MKTNLLMKTNLVGAMAVVVFAFTAVSARAEFDYYAGSTAESEQLLSASDGEADEEEFDYISFAYGDAAQQDDGCKGGCQECCCLRTTPNMIGDSIGVPIVFGNGVANIGLSRHYLKVGENNNVLPTTRVAFGYNYYSDVPTSWTAAGNVTGTTDISEYKLLFEKAFACGKWSANLILPFYDTVSFNQPAGVFPNVAEGGEFGNLGFGIKRLLRRTSNYALSGGLLVEAPTASNYSVAGTTIANDQWFFTPYAALQYTPNDRLFATSFVSYRLRTGDDEIVGPGAPTDFIQSNRLMVDGAVGYWLFRNDHCRRFVTGLAPTVELHYTTFTEDLDPTLISAIYYNRVDLLNMTAGVTAELSNGGTFALAAVAPLRNNPFPGGNLPTDRSMDWELVAQYNHRF